MSNQELLVFVQAIDYKLQEEKLHYSVREYLEKAKKELVNEILCDELFEEFCESKGMKKSPLIESYWNEMSESKSNNSESPKSKVCQKTYNEKQESWNKYFRMSE